MPDLDRCGDINGKIVYLCTRRSLLVFWQVRPDFSRGFFYYLCRKLNIMAEEKKYDHALDK